MLPQWSEDFSLLVTFLLVTFSWLFRGFFRGFFVVFSWLFRGPHFGQILRVLALEKSSEMVGLEKPKLAHKEANPGTWVPPTQGVCAAMLAQWRQWRLCT